MAINLDKITLEKQGDSHKIDLSKGSDTQKEIIINLNWSQEKRGFWGSLLGSSSEIDLDLGCYYELKDGQKQLLMDYSLHKDKEVREIL